MPAFAGWLHPFREVRRGVRLGRIRKHGPAVAGISALFGLFTLIAATSHEIPRCPRGSVAAGERCCGEGQRVVKGACRGRPLRCPDGFERRDDGCVVVEGRVKVRGGESSWRPPDTISGAQGEHATTGFFIIDKTEVTWARWKLCTDEKACPPLTTGWGGDPGQAAHGVTIDEARRFCAWAGGRLPRDAEWLRVALGAKETRYPWGDPDALCLRAAYGMVDGPCGSGAGGPDTVGSRPAGATPGGVLDVAGNVAEWVDDAHAPAGQGVVRGGSFADGDATPLRARSRRVIGAQERQPWVGFRCAYDGTDELMP